MAARLNPAPISSPAVMELRRLNARALDPLLEEEIGAWRDTLEWSFEKSAELVRRFLDLRALNGYALVEHGAAVGYVYYVLEEIKGLVGDLYVMRSHRTVERENSLLSAALDSMMAHPQIRRIESQLMMVEHSTARAMPGARSLSAFPRNFMRIDLRRANLPESNPRRAVHLEQWNDSFQDPAAHLIATAYARHVDSRINDQYRSAVGARRFLHNIVQYPGCGAFYRGGSFAAFDPVRGALVGISLASLVSADCGHITQICVAPEVKGSGVGYSLLRQSLAALKDAGCRATTLTVTSANEEAVDLYERVGFRTIRRFAAWVWEGFR